MSGSESQLVRLTRSELYQAFPSRERVSPVFTPLSDASGHSAQPLTPRQDPQTHSNASSKGPAPLFNLNLNTNQSNFQWKQGPVLQVSSAFKRHSIPAQSEPQEAKQEDQDVAPEIDREESNSSFRVAEITTPHFKMTPALLSKTSEEPPILRAFEPNSDASAQVQDEQDLGKVEFHKQVPRSVSRPERGFNHSPNSPFILARSFSFQRKARSKYQTSKLATRDVYNLASREKLNKIQPEQASRMENPSYQEHEKASTSSEAIQSENEAFETPIGKRLPDELEDHQVHYIRTTASRKGELHEEIQVQEYLPLQDEEEHEGVEPQELCFESVLSEDVSMEGKIQSIPEDTESGKWEHFPPNGDGPSGWFYYDSQSGLYYSQEELASYSQWVEENTGVDRSLIHGLGELQITKFKSKEKERGAQYKPKRKYRKKIHGNNPAYSKGKLLTAEERQARLNKMIEKTHMIGTYICKVCGKIFKTGQGLGGHMSKMHYGVSDFLKKNRLTQTQRKKQQELYESSDASYSMET